MPFKSEKQRRYLYANQPKLAKKWSNMYGDKIVGLGNVKSLKGKSLDKEIKNTKKVMNSLQKIVIDEGNMNYYKDLMGIQTYYLKLNSLKSKKQGYKDREDESLGMRRGAERGKKQSYKDRRNESYGKFGKRDKEKKGKNKINKITGLNKVVNNNVSTLKQISSELKNASKLHKGQALKIDNMLTITGLGNIKIGGLSTDEYLMRIAATLLSKGLSPSKFTKSKAKSLTKGLKARKKVYELIDKYPADITIYMKRIKNL